jgi:tetratricopeptide (TPR) repeat protein
MEFVRTDGNIDVYRDKATGTEYFVGRTKPASPADQARHDELYRSARDLIKGLILIDGINPAPLNTVNRQQLSDGTRKPEEVVAINDGNWSAMWLLGKICQRLGDYPRGLEWFSRAHRINPDQPDVAREAAIAAMESGKPELAVDFCERAIEAKPADAGLRANLALALLFSGKPSEAHAVVTESLKMDPSDKITGRIGAIIEEVLAGRRLCPHHMRELS